MNSGNDRYIALFAATSPCLSLNKAQVKPSNPVRYRSHQLGSHLHQ
jgi:hypothetical protein